MNEYTYKAKKLDDGEWTQGSLFAGINNSFILQSIRVNPEDENKFSVTGSRIDKDTICRYADNGLWENDIIVNETELGIIRYGMHDKSYGFYVDWKSPLAKAMTHKCVTTWLYDEDTRIVGNDIDNPELAEQIVEAIKNA